MANCRILVVLLFLCGMFMGCLTANLEEEVELTWGGERAKIVEGGNVLSLTLDKASGSGFQSKREYLFARIDMEIKLVPGNSAGTVTAFYLSSQGAYHDEIDFEFLGNVSGQPYTLHTNVFTKGTGNREQQFHLWFDPTKNFHQYSILWNPQRIIFLVDNMAIRVFENLESVGIPYPKNQAMRLHSSLWNADEWATRGGLVKTDWSKAPFTAYYRNFKASTCSLISTNSCGSGSVNNWENQKVDAYGRRRLRWVQRYFMIYNYCSDYKRFPHGRPRECRLASRFL